tara:strand:+ start:107 stop:313 length:207 start_codon:yes stop_codon:yes gene_type:complete
MRMHGYQEEEIRTLLAAGPPSFNARKGGQKQVAQNRPKGERAPPPLPQDAAGQYVRVLIMLILMRWLS